MESNLFALIAICSLVSMFLRIGPLFTDEISFLKKHETYFSEVGRFMAPTIMTYIAYKMVLKAGEDAATSQNDYFAIYAVILATVLFFSFATAKGHQSFFYSIVFILATFLIST